MTGTQQDKDFGEKFLWQIVKWIGKYLAPDQVFNKRQLSDWAEANGFEKP